MILLLSDIRVFMENLNTKIAELKSELASLDRIQKQKITQITHQLNELERLLSPPSIPSSPPVPEVTATPPPVVAHAPKEKVEVPPPPPVNTPASPVVNQPPVAAKATPPPPISRVRKKPKKVMNWEKFIGENLANKIGIFILLLGLGIGAKYSIEHNLISPVARIIIGYLISGGLLFTGFRLVKKYLNFAVVLISGSVTAMYFLTYFSYSLYHIFPWGLTYPLMLAITVFQGWLSLRFKNQVLAIIGFVGAYAIPFLLNTNSGNTIGLMWYMVIINSGVIWVAIKQEWRTLFYSAMGTTWLVFFTTVLSHHMGNMSVLGGIFFASMFYLQFHMCYGLTNVVHAKNNMGTQSILMVNTTLYGLLCLAILDTNSVYFTPINKASFALVAAAINAGLFVLSKRLSSSPVAYMYLALTTIMANAALFYYFDGNVLTALWSSEALLLFLLAQRQQIVVLERSAIVLTGLSLISLVTDWNAVYAASLETKMLAPFFNANFSTTLFALGCYAGLAYLSFKHTVMPTSWRKLLPVSYTEIVTVLTVAIAYLGVYLEIDYLYRIQGYQITLLPDYVQTAYLNTQHLNTIVKWAYTFAFVGALHWLTQRIKALQSAKFAVYYASFMLSIIFLIMGSFSMSQLVENYANHAGGFGNLVVKYAGLGALAFMLYSLFKFRKTFETSSTRYIMILLYFIGVVVMSFEIIHFGEIFHLEQAHKIGVTLFWGIYAAALTYIGISKNLKYIRIGALILFSITLAKLMFYDISHFSTLAKTVVFVLVGGLLLLVSFLYNKFQQKIK